MQYVKGHFNIIVPSTSRYSKRSLSFKISKKNVVHIFHLSLAFQLSYPARPQRLTNLMSSINLIVAPCIFCRITQIYQPTNAHIISHKTLLKHFKTLRHVSILSDHHQGVLFLAKVIL